MLHFVFLFIFFVKCLANIPVNVGIIYSSDDPWAEIAIRHIESRFKMMTNYSLKPYKINIKNQDSFMVQNAVCCMIESGVYAIVGPTTEEANPIVQSISENFELPQLQTFWNPTPFTNTSQVLNLHPEPALLAKALATLVKEMNWRSFAVMYENDDSLIRLQEVLQLQRSQADDFPITIRKLLPVDDQSPLLKEIKNKSQIHIILDCKSEKIKDILLQAQKLNMLENYRSYLLTSLDAHTIKFGDLLNNRTNITTIRMLDTTRKTFKTTIRDWVFNEWQRTNNTVSITPESVKMSTALLYDAVDILFTSFARLSHVDPFHLVHLSCDKKAIAPKGWALGEGIKNTPSTNGTLSEFLTGPIAFDSFGRRTNFKLQIVELLYMSHKITGEWYSNEPNRINYLLPTSSKDIFKQKGPFRIASKQGAPYFMINKSNEYEGYVVDLIEQISIVLNFTYKFYVVPDNNYGSYDQETKEWNGLIKEIIDRNADFAVCDLTITYERGSAVDFSVPFMTLGISILFSKATKEPPDLLTFMNPLSPGIWLYMATAYLVISMIIYFAARLTPREWEASHPCDDNPTELENIWSFKNTFWLTLGSIMAQGCDLMPKGMSTRMITSMWWFFSLIITSSYTANLAAFLTNERMGPQIKNAEDLVKQTEIKYGCVLGGATAVFFRDSNFSTYQKMWRTMEQADPSNFQKSNDDGVNAVKARNRKFAFLMESSTIEYVKERNCELIQVGDWLDTKGYGIAMAFNSPFRTGINSAILKLQENGAIRNLKEKWWKERDGGGKCKDQEDTKEDEAAELGIDNVGGVFVVLTAGVFLAFLMAVFEFLWNVKKISVQEQMTPAEAFARELKFAVKVSESKKVVPKKKTSPEET